MNNGFGDRIRKLIISDDETASQVFALQKKSYQVEAKLIGSVEIPPLMESLEEMMNTGETFIGYYEKGEIVGVISYKCDDQGVDIHRMMVHPNHFRKGIARHLLTHLIETEIDGREISVSTGSANKPAICFYEKLGFEKVGEKVVGKGLSLTQFIKRIG